MTPAQIGDSAPSGAVPLARINEIFSRLIEEFSQSPLCSKEARWIVEQAHEELTGSTCRKTTVPAAINAGENRGGLI